MVGTICPAGGRERNFGRRLTDSLSFLLGAMLGGILLGFVLGRVGALAPHPNGTNVLAIATLIVAVLAGLREFGFRRIPLPDARRQVSWSAWYRRGTRLAALTWGAELGVGFLTRLNSAAFYAVLAGVLWLGEPAQVILVLGAFGFVRGAEPVVALLLQPTRPIAMVNSLFERRVGIGKISGASCAALAVTLLAGLMGGG